MAKLPPIRVHTERIDAERTAVLASCFKLGHRTRWIRDAEGKLIKTMASVLYGWSVFVLVDNASTRRYEHEGIGRRAIEALAAREQPPFIDYCENISGWADYA